MGELAQKDAVHPKEHTAPTILGGREASSHPTSGHILHPSSPSVFSQTLDFTALVSAAAAAVLNRVWLLSTPWTVACQVPLSMELSRQEYWSGLPFPPDPTPYLCPLCLLDPSTVTSRVPSVPWLTDLPTFFTASLNVPYTPVFTGICFPMRTPVNGAITHRPHPRPYNRVGGVNASSSLTNLSLLLVL